MTSELPEPGEKNHFEGALVMDKHEEKGQNLSLLDFCFPGVFVARKVTEENKDEIKKAVDVGAKAASKTVDEVKSTKDEVADALKTRPVTTTAEVIVFGPVAPIVDVKARKVYNNVTDTVSNWFKK